MILITLLVLYRVVRRAEKEARMLPPLRRLQRLPQLRRSLMTSLVTTQRQMLLPLKQ